MASNDERREVAARLREQSAWTMFTNFDNCIGDLCDAVFEDEGNLNDMFRLQSQLADLIEPEPERTGHLEFEYNPGEVLPRCSECKKKIGKASRYCQWCGARMVE